VATRPNSVWSWDITKLLGPEKWTYFQLYVIIDIYSRYVPGWLLARRESAELAEHLIAETIRKHHVIAVIGDGAMSAGMAYEAMNNAGAMKERLIVILNDNDMSIAPPVGAMSAYLARLVSSQTYRGLRGALAGALTSSAVSAAASSISQSMNACASGRKADIVPRTMK